MRNKKLRLPTTHSDVLWHFTGGPKWNSKRNRQENKLKPTIDAFKISLAILKSQTIKLGNYHEVIKVIAPKVVKWDEKLKKRKVYRNKMVELITSPVCCLADIHESQLFHHAKRYGKMGIGFKRSSVLKAGFNPVFYTLHKTEIATNFYNTQNILNYIDIYDIESEIDSFVDNIESDLCSRCESNVDLSNNIISGAEDIQDDANNALESLSDIMSFVKTFDNSEFETIYAEREWRSIKPYSFTMNDISKIIFPNEKLKNQFINKHLNDLKIPKKVKLCLFDEICT